MERYEYRVISRSSIAECENACIEMASQGWRLVGVGSQGNGSDRLYFERAKS